MAGVANTGALKGKTLFITGASRGIGLAIGLKAARDGANIVIAAKTAEPHKKLAGTIYTAAKEIENVGGNALAVVTDIRDEENVESAVNQAVKHFGGIDILINNASAISLTGTLETAMKKYDLMNTVNARGTFLTSKVCLPYLLKGPNSHILTISPPLDMNPKWFKPHVAYTMAKYGMSMCALGMAEEFKGKVAVNTLWPRTAIYTAAMEMLGGGLEVASKCRKVDIMADAAYTILTRPTTYTGNFAIDEQVLAEAGVKDLSHYAVDSTQQLMIDLFVGDTTQTSAGTMGVQTGFAAKYFTELKNKLSPDLVKSIGSDFVIDVEGAGQWYVDLKTGNGNVGKGDGHVADVTVVLSEQHLQEICLKKASTETLYMNGQIKVVGNLLKAMKLTKVLA